MADSHGRSTRRWRRLRDEVFARRANCCRCGQPIDYSLPYRDASTGEVNADSKSVDHFPFPLSQRPDLAEDLTNLAAAHMRCNSEAQDAGVTHQIGTTSRAW